MYLDYFSLDRHPFRITPDPSLFFPGGQDGRGVILNALIYGITSGEGILKVTGEVGSGKTMLCRMLEEKLPSSVEIVYIANPRLSAREILYAIAIELKLEVTAATERLKVMHLLQDYLLTRHSKGGTVVVFIEEAQSMPLETLEEIRLLSNLETHRHKLMQIVLFGQPELDKILAQNNIRQLRERITHSFRLEPLTVQATGDYLRYRLKAAGCPREHIFSTAAENLIARASSGLTRRINILADKSLLAAYADSPSRQPTQDGDEPLVLPRHVKAAIRDSDYRYSKVSPWLLGGLGLTALVVAAIVVVTQDLLPGGAPAGTTGRVIAEASTASVQTPVAASTEPVDSDAGNADMAATLMTAQSPTADVSEGTNDAVEPAPAASGAAPIQEPAESVAAVADITEAPSGQEGVMTATVQEVSEQAKAVADPVPEPTLASLDAPAESPDSADVTTTMTDTDRDPLVDREASAPPAVPVAAPAGITTAGLAELRMAPTADWLRQLDNKSGYTIQMFSVPSTNPSGLEEYLQFLQLVSLLDDTYICFMPVSSENSGRWQVMHKEFQGVTPARNFIDTLPAYIRQYGPYVRNLNGIECSYPVETRD